MIKNNKIQFYEIILQAFRLNLYLSNLIEHMSPEFKKLNYLPRNLCQFKFDFCYSYNNDILCFSRDTPFFFLSQGSCFKYDFYAHSSNVVFHFSVEMSLFCSTKILLF